ncbi:MAG: PQQ-binding-like beta-propeller repeat protein [Acidobacteria bacterium]|nr:PQQ-binding-like beta-propeller repeat protein [Acidobacteriota bacterium]
MKTAANGSKVAAAFLVAIVLCQVAPAAAQDWPSWRGRGQAGVSEITGLVSSWSPDGENLIWSDAWVGRSTPAVFDGRVCANGRAGNGVDEQEVVACWNAETGSKLWQHSFNPINTTVPFNRLGWGSVTGDPETGYLYAMNIDGELNAFDRDGTIVWGRRLAEELGRASGYGGRTSTPLVDEDQLLLSIIGAGWGNLGGPPRHRYFGFDKLTGDVRWASTPGGNVEDLNTQSVGVVGVVNGERLWIDGNADGRIYALKARTGEKVWEFHLSKQGIHVSPVLVGETVYAAHSEENIDASTMGRVVAIDATGTGDVTATHERWRADELGVGFSSPLAHDGRLYVIDNSANLYALDAASGAVQWKQSVGTVGKASPVWADGKLFIAETNGNVVILQPGPTGATELDHDALMVAAEGRPAEIYGSFAVAYGRLYLTSEVGIYCIGNRGDSFVARAGTSPDLGSERPATGTPSILQVVPADVIASAGETVEFEVRAYDAGGRFVGTQSATWAVDGLAGGSVSPQGVLTTDARASNQAGTVTATVGGLTGVAQVRVFSPLPWSENFESGRPPFWIGGGGALSVEDLGGNQVFRKGPSRTGLHRHAIYMGPADMAGYTVQVDVMSTQKGRRRPDIGVVNSGYTMGLQGNRQKIQIHAWAAELRIKEEVDFPWEPDTWYRLKLRVDIEGDRGIVRGKVWARDATEPADWTITAEDPVPNRTGSPGIIGYSPIDIYFDNVSVVENQ